jgi:hypothetical protein
MPDPALDIRGSGQAFFIYEGTRRVAGPFWGQHMATAALRGTARRLRPATARPCLCCGTAFPSTGPGHRLCKTCRGQA